MAWLRSIGGRLESRYRYSKDIVYNNFPWPNVDEKQRDKISEISKEIINARRRYPELNYGHLYNPIIMPNDLRKVHNKMDREVDKLYTKDSFPLESDRISFLMNLFEKMNKVPRP